MVGDGVEAAVGAEAGAIDGLGDAGAVIQLAAQALGPVRLAIGLGRYGRSGP